jgi:adenylosuccinate synthase
MKDGRFNIIVGGQAGSEAKGKMSAYLARKFKISGLFMAASPNAGHTYVDDKGNRYVTYHLPAASVVTDDHVPVMLGPTSVINPDKLLQEIEDLRVFDIDRLFIHKRAMTISHVDLTIENQVGLSDIGSTLQGVGSARMRKLRRGEASIKSLAIQDGILERFVSWDDTFTIQNILDTRDGAVLAEMTQGFDLDLEHGIDPRYCTSKMINPMMYLAEAGIHWSHVGDVYGVIRPYPIRVNNRTGSSGPYPDSTEITWEELRESSRAPDDISEITTTTKLQRRVFTFSWERFREFIRVCRPDYLCLQFANHIDWNVYGVSEKAALTGRVGAFIDELEKAARVPVAYVGTGPRNDQMVDMGVDK